MVLEGGSIHVDGEGNFFPYFILMIVWECYGDVVVYTCYSPSGYMNCYWNGRTKKLNDLL